MKSTWIFLLPVTLLLLASCYIEENWLDRNTDYNPILMTRTQLEQSISFHPPRDFIRPGKIYTKGQYIFINEKYKGIHIIDNSNPSSPQKIGFILVPGSIDLAVKNNSLYVDNAVDLVTIDISKITEPKETDRAPNTFPELLPPDAEGLPNNFSAAERPDNTIIIGWEK